MKKILIANILLLMLFSTFVLAQTTSYERDFELARRFILLDKYEEAIELLEELQMKYPHDIRVIEQLKTAYFALKKYDKIVDVLNAQLSASPKNIGLWIELGGIYLNLGKIEKATDAFNRAVDIDPQAIASYNSIASRYRLWGYIDEAISFLEKAKKGVSQKGAFSMELGTLYEINKDFQKAIQEYIEYLNFYPDRIGEVRTRISTMGKDIDQLAEIEKVLKSSIKGSPMDRTLFPLLAQIQVRKGDYEAAFESYIESEKYEKRFKYIPSFSQEALAAKEYKIALRAADYLIEKGEPFMQVEAKFTKGEALRGLERYEEAIGIYNEIIETCPPAVCAKAYLQIGKIHFYDYEDIDKGTQFFKKVVEEFPGNPIMEEGIKEYVNALYRLGNVDEVYNFLIKLVNTQSFENDLVLFKLAEVYFLTNDFKKSGEYFSKLIMNYPESFYINDALNYLMLTQDEENEQFGEITEMIYLSKIGKYEDCYQKVQDLLKSGTEFQFEDYLNWFAGEVAYELGDYKQSLKYLDEVQRKFPDSYFTPIALELKGDIFFEQEDYARAAEAYNTILMDHPDAVNLNSIRKKLRVIETRT
ncbi:tetratricopeptide repeat protein [bacterium]|nr:tetratricopeptide repeat protein [bacterium]